MTNSAANTACAERHLAAPHARTSALIGRFFVLTCLLCLWPGPAYPENHHDTVASSCRGEKFDENITVKKTIDGDTIILGDDRHLRLIGINTPEISHDGRPAQIGAVEAHQYLSGLLRVHRTLRLRYDLERTDRYGRTLAHLFLPDGTNVQSLLLERGLATTLTVPPNLAFADCYATVATRARSQGSGLWAYRQYQPSPVAAITSNDLGYRIVRGGIIRTARGRNGFWIDLARNFSLRIDGKDLQYFHNLEGLDGKQVTASGMLYYSNGAFRMQIRYPTDLVVQ